MTTPTKYTAQTWTTLREEIALWVVERVKTDGRAFLMDAAQRFQISPKTARRVLDELVTDGRLVRFGVRSGYGALGVAIVGADLQSLLDFARTRVSANATPQAGRRDVTADRRLEWITESQFEAARAATTVAAWGVTGDKHRLSEVGPQHLRWSEAAGEFEIIARLATWSDQLAQARHRSAECWHPSKNTAARQKHLAGMRTLLDLAATAGRIARGVVHTVEFRQHAAEWQPWVEQTVGRTTQADLNPSARKDRVDGARVLARFCSRFGWNPESSIQWDRVQHQIRQEYAQDVAPLSERDFKTSRLVYRLLHAAGEITGPVWGKSDEGRMTLVSEQEIRHAVVSRDFGAWGVPRLTEGPEGLTAYISWLDARLDTDQIRAMGLPDRALLHPTVQQRLRAERRALQGRSMFTRSLSVLHDTARNLAQFAGWATRAGRYDGGTQSLSDLARPELMRAYVLEKAKDGRMRRTIFGTIASELSTVNSPFLESQAPDSASAARHKQAAEDLAVLAAKHTPKQSERFGAEKKMRAWTGATDLAAEAYAKLEQLIAIKVREMEVAYGKPVADIEQDAVNGTPCPRRPKKFAIAARDAVLFNFQRLIPLRPANVVGLKIGTSFRSSGAEPWEGAVWYIIAADAYKGRRVFDPSLIRPGEVGDPQAERNIARNLLRIYLAPGFARDILLTPRNGKPLVSEHLFVPSFSSTKRLPDSCTGSWTVRGLSSAVKAAVLKHASELGLQRSALKDTFGASTSHVWRHILGSFGVETGKTAKVSALLGHAHVSTTERVYASRSPRAASPHQFLSAVPMGAVTQTDSKVCPDCAEHVKAAARKCRFCQYRWEESA